MGTRNNYTLSGFLTCALLFMNYNNIKTGRLDYEWKECTQNQISAYAVGSVYYNTHDLDHVHPRMQHGNTGLLTAAYESGK